MHRIEDIQVPSQDRGEQFHQRRLFVAFAPSRADGEGIVERLPSHAGFRRCYVASVVEKFFVAHSRGEIERMEPRYPETRAENRDAALRVDGVTLATAVNREVKKVTDEIAGTQRLVGALVVPDRRRPQEV